MAAASSAFSVSSASSASSAASSVASSVTNTSSGVSGNNPVSSGGNIRIILGSMTFGPAIGAAHADGSRCTLPMYCQTPPDVAEAELKALAQCDYARIKSGPEAGKVLLDTASAYQNAYTEETLGAIFSKNPSLRHEFSIHTKANPMQLPYKSLSKESILYQANNSLKSMKIDHIDIYYLHMPDIHTDIESTLDGIEQLYQEKKIKEFGISNYPAWKVVDIYYRCQKRGKDMILPTVYQGCYNALTRAIEFDLTAALREFNIRCYHYNPLAGGLLTGKYASLDDQMKESGRFGTKNLTGPLYSARYWKQAYFDGLEELRKACQKENISMAAASLRWMIHHSILSSKHNDGIILGASNLKQLEENLAAVSSGPLPQSLVEGFDKGWEVSRFVASQYARNYGSTSGASDLYLKTYHQSYVPKSLL